MMALAIVAEMVYIKDIKIIGLKATVPWRLVRDGKSALLLGRFFVFSSRNVGLEEMV